MRVAAVQHCPPCVPLTHASGAHKRERHPPPLFRPSSLPLTRQEGAGMGRRVGDVTHNPLFCSHNSRFLTFLSPLPHFCNLPYMLLNNVIVIGSEWCEQHQRPIIHPFHVRLKSPSQNTISVFSIECVSTVASCTGLRRL